jgi:hypothetical protein
MKHLKPFHLFENIQSDEDLLEIKDIIQELADEWDIQWVDEVHWFSIETGSFLYNIRRIEGNITYQILIDIILPSSFHKFVGDENAILLPATIPVYEKWNLFIKEVEECVQRLFNIGYERVQWVKDGRHLQILM